MDADAGGDEYDSYLMYSNEVMRSPAGSKCPSVAGDGQYTLVCASGAELALCHSTSGLNPGQIRAIRKPDQTRFKYVYPGLPTCQHRTFVTSISTTKRG